MSRYCQLVIGPAGSGKSTYCSNLARHCEDIGRRIHLFNLDPAAEYFDYTPDVDIRELISLDDVLDDEDQEVKFGPNGGLVFCMEFLMENLEWLDGQLGEDEDDYWVFDCPGQIELYTHLDVMKSFASHLKNTLNFNCCAVFLFDVKCITDESQFISGSIASLSAMVKLEVPFINIFTKVDLLNDYERECMNSYMDLETHDELLGSLSSQSHKSGSSAFFRFKYEKLTKALVNVLEDYQLTSFHALDITEEGCLNNLLLVIDASIQYGEDLDVKDNYPEDGDGDLTEGA